MLGLDDFVQRSIRACTLLLALVGTAWPAAAGDGVLEINGTCAVQTGCFPGDEPGFPVTINQRGSYRLTSNLGLSTASVVDFAFIEINANDVTLDLGGFSISCRNPFVVGDDACRGSGSGVLAVGRGATVQNGIVRGMAGPGINVALNSRVEGIYAAQNAIGISAGAGSIVSGNRSAGNRDTGIDARGTGSTVSGNIASSNGSDGILARSGSRVQLNTVRQNGRYGLNLSSNAAYSQNVMTGNAAGSVQGGFNLGLNFCGANSICP